MGIDLEIRTSAETGLTAGELRNRLAQAGIEPHPDYEDEYLLAGGTLRLASAAAVAEGTLASVRLSWTASQSDWQQVIALADLIGGRVYDETSDRYIDAGSADGAVDDWLRVGASMRAVLGDTGPDTR